MEHIMKCIIFFTFTVQLASAATHSLQYIATGITPGINFPEFTLTGLVDGEQFVYYDSNIRKMIPKTEWIKKIVNDEAKYWDSQTQIHQGVQENYKVDLIHAKARFNQTEGVHTVQWMCGCELDDDGNKRGYEQYGYDGEDFISLDLNTGTWTAAKPQAAITKQQWDSQYLGPYMKNYLENTCIEWLHKYVGYGRSTLERTVSPKVDLFQKDSSSPVVCHATGFFPKSVMISWQKNGQDLDEDVQLRETTPNQDGTFQKRSVLTVSPEKLDSDKYTCVIQHSSLEKEMVLQVPDRRVLNGGGLVGIIVGAIVAVLLLVIIGCVGVFIWKKKSGFKPVNSSEDSASDKS